MNRNILKKVLSFTGVILILYAFAFAFAPECFNGKVVNQGDVSSWVGMVQETRSYNAQHPEDPTAWTNSMFGGMPTTTMTTMPKGDYTRGLYRLLSVGPAPVSYFFLAMTGALLLLLAFGCSLPVSAGAAIAVSFCTYNAQIIQVGHNTKIMAIGLMSWVLAALVFTYRQALDKESGKARWLSLTLLGASLFGLAMSFQIKANHPQISFYLAIIVLLYALTQFVWVLMKKNRKLIGRFFTASALLLVVGLTGIATNATVFVPTMKYTPYSMRGGSELSHINDGNEVQGRDGLALGYATAWSYGIEETPNFLIPYFNGGPSAGNPGLSSNAARFLLASGCRGKEFDANISRMPLYWGPQPFTAGPMYMGAVTVFLFILGLFAFKGKEKWWIAGACLIALLLGWGNNVMWFTRLWYEHVPLYNKFRTVSMALVVLQVCMPLLGFMTLDRIIKGKIDRRDAVNGSYAALIICGGFCLAFALVPSLAGDFVSVHDKNLPPELAGALVQDRMSMLRSSALRSLFFVLVPALAIIWGAKGREGFATGKRGAVVLGLIVLLVAVDMFSTGREYLNSSHFVDAERFDSSVSRKRPVDEMILEDTDPDYRVLDLSVDIFNDSHQCYWHKCIGGYSPAKIQRYQDLIERYITPECKKLIKLAENTGNLGEYQDNLPYLPVLSMLNARYIILDSQIPPVTNSHALGNAWFVSRTVSAKNPDDEIRLLGKIDPAECAVIKTGTSVSSEAFEPAERAIELLTYEPNELRYAVRCEKPGVAVFSEIWYPDGWKAWIEPAGQCGEVVKGKYVPTENAKDLTLFCADWTLRAAEIPSGSHEIIMRYEPSSYDSGKNISKASSLALIAILILSCMGFAICENKQN
ncbi:MAG: hypothetical protein HUJ94_00790 [Bacteroidales bacterium]|nr:hypothetical protein [Bacteroidales bacterium]